MSYRNILFLPLLLISLNCATLRGQGQRIKVNLDSNIDADILFNGKWVGTAPGFIRLPRKHSADLQVISDHAPPTDIKLETSYRWGDSFFGNMVFFTFAPIGWLVDLISGSAWDYNKYSALKSDGVAPNLNRIKSVAIAPPHIDNEILSDELGPIISKKIGSVGFSEKDIIRSYESTEEIFSAYGYTNMERVNPDYSDDLYFDLRSSHVLESQVKEDLGQYSVRTRLFNIYSEKIEREDEITIPKSETKYTKSGQFLKKFTALFSLVPNTVTFDFSTPNVEIAALPPDGSPIYWAAAERNGVLLNVLTGFGFRTVKSPNLIRDYRFTFSFVPDLSFKYQRVFFNRAEGRNDILNIGFNRYSLTAGVGPELGLESPVGYFYIHWIPQGGPSWITWQQQSENRESFRTHMVHRVEMGYMFFIAKSAVVKFFTRSMNYSGDQWAGILSRSLGSDIKVPGANDQVAGVSLGYYFSASKTTLKRWLR